MDRFLADLVGSEGLRSALTLAGIGTALAAAIAVVAPRWRPLPLGGAVFSAAALWVLHTRFAMPWAVAVGAAALVAGVVIGRGLWARIVAALPGAYIIVTMGGLGDDVPTLALVCAIAAAAALATDFDAAAGDRSIGLPMLAVTVAGVVITVPDTERAFVLLGAAAPLALAGPPIRLIRLGPGAAAAVAVIGWVGGLAWTARPGATIGAIAALGLFLAEPLGRRMAGARSTALASLIGGGAVATVAVLAIHGSLVIGGSRFAGLLREPFAAAAVALVVLVVGLVLAVAPAPLADDGPERANRPDPPSDP